MAGNLNQICTKLITALNLHGYMLVISNKRFMGKEGRPVNYYCLANAVWNEDTRRYDHFEIYKTASMLRMLFYLRDLWYELNGWELPTDQEQWNNIRETLKAKEIEYDG